jgi:hypothetical protein
VNGFMVCGSYLQLLDLIPGLQARLYAAFYDFRALNRGKDVGGIIGSVDGDVAMLVNVQPYDSTTSFLKRGGGVAVPAHAPSALARACRRGEEFLNQTSLVELVLNLTLTSHRQGG